MTVLDVWREPNNEHLLYDPAKTSHEENLSCAFLSVFSPQNHQFLLTVHNGIDRVRSGPEVPPLLPNRRTEDPPFPQSTAEVAELVDALASGVSEH
mgnify:CR=1 FL=1